MTLICPHCGIELDAVANVNDEAPPIPKRDDPFVCVHCFGLSFFDYGPFGMLLRTPTEYDEPLASRILTIIENAKRGPQ